MLGGGRMRRITAAKIETVILSIKKVKSPRVKVAPHVGQLIPSFTECSYSKRDFC